MEVEGLLVLRAEGNVSAEQSCTAVEMYSHSRRRERERIAALACLPWSSASPTSAILLRIAKGPPPRLRTRPCSCHRDLPKGRANLQQLQAMLRPALLARQLRW